MATDKRERQRQNRAAKQVEVNKQKRRQRIIDRTKRVAVWAVVLVVMFIAASVVWG